jgi:hypothetical protein
MKRIAVLLFIGVVATLLLAAYQSFGTSAQETASCSPTGSETVATDQPDYLPDETARISGSGYAPLCGVTVRVTRPDGSVVTGDGSGTAGSDVVSTDDAGNLAYDYILDGVQGLYTVDVLGQDDAVLASTTFTDAQGLLSADAARLVRRAIFERGDTAYARATDLYTTRSYRWEVAKPDGSVVQSSSCFTGVTQKDDSYTIQATDPIGGGASTPWVYWLREFPNTTCAGSATSYALSFWVAKAFAFDNPTDRNNCTAEPCANAKTYFFPGSTVYIRVLGFLSNVADINDTWIKPDTSTACANTAGADRPDSDSSLRLSTSYPILPPETPDSPCPALAAPPDQGFWQLNLVPPYTDPPTRSRWTVQLDAFTLGPAEADAKILAQWVMGCEDVNHNSRCDLGEPLLPAPSEIPVSENVPIMVQKTVHNNGPYGPVDLQTVKTATASPDCTVTPATHTEAIDNVPVSLDITHNEPFTIHCDKPSEHTFTFDNVISVKTPGVTDPTPGNNTAHTAWTVDAIANADLQVVAQRTVVWPASDVGIKVSESVLVTLETDVRNNGPYGSVEALFEGWLAAPTPCTAVPALISQQVILAAGETKTIQQQFTIHCSEKCLRNFVFNNRITAKDPHVLDLPTANNTASRNLSVDTWAQADVKIVSQGFVGAPAEMQVSESRVVTLRKVLRNDGPYTGNVTVTITETATAPADCTISPLSYSQDVVLTDNLNSTVDENFTIHCTKDGIYSFSVDNVVGAPHEVHVEDPNLPNTAHTGLLVQAVGEADVKIISQQLVNPPSEIPVGQPVVVTLRKVLHNNGPYSDPVEVAITKTATAPADCTIDPPTHTQQVVLPNSSVNVTVDETFTIHCSKASSHTFSVDNVVSGPKDPIIIDPDMTNNTAHTDLSVDAVAQVDVAVSQTILTPPTQINVSEHPVVTVQKTLTASVQPPATPAEIPSVTVTVTKTASAPAGCSVVPVGPIAVQKVVSTTTPLVFEEQFTIHCSEPSTHVFTFDNAVSGPSDAHITDPNMGNNTGHSALSVNALAQVDVAVTQTIVSPPTEIDVSSNVVITLQKTITATVLNQQPYNIPSVTVTVTKTASAPPDCTVVAPAAVQKVVLTTTPLVYTETFTIHCSKPSTHGPFTFNDTVSGPKDAHISDPTSGNNSASTSLTVNAIGHADMKVVDQSVENPPAEVPISEDVPIVLDKVIHNDGPWAPVEAVTTTVATAPADCTVQPGVHIQQFHNLPVSVDILHHEPFTIHCTKLGTYTFTFADTVGLKEPHMHDPVPGNNSATTELTVDSVSQADIKIVSVGFIDWPTKLPLGVDTDITLEMVLHNNGPWTPVDIAIDSDATAPTGCTIVAKNVPSSISAVPVSIDQVVDEVWTIKCTETGLKTFGFDNSIDVATPYVSDPNQANNSSHTMRSVRDDASCEADYDGDGLCDASDLCPANPDCDGDGVSDGSDNCPTVKNPTQANFDGDGIGDACDTDDTDADNFRDAVELYLETDPTDSCPDVLGADDAWPLDMNQDKHVTVVGDVLKYSGRIGATGGPPADAKWLQRLDLNMDNSLTVVGDVLKFAGTIGKGCE